MLASKILNDRYRLIETVGTGGMATVYRGHDVLLDRPVAIKVLREPYAGDPAFRNRFLEEARAAAQLDHPNIVKIYDVGIHEEQPYLVMELVEGEDLKTLIRRRAPFSIPEALDLACQIADGVGSAHQAGLIHCDLKPQNVLVTPDHTAKVTDFGIARAFQGESAFASQEKEQVIWGSPHYLSPEQARGERPTPASDVYSIGVMLYEMLSGVPPFHDQDTTALLIKHLEETPPPLQALNPKIPPRLNWLVNKVLAKDKAGRYRNAHQLYLALTEYLKGNQEATIPQAAVPSAPSTSPKGRVPEPQEAADAAAQERVEEDEGSDWLLWVLWIVAALAVLGLIPLWGYVYQVYNATPSPSPATVITPTATPAGRTVSVPNLIGLDVADAERLAQGYELQFAVESERIETDALPGTVLQQEPAPGARVLVSTTVYVVKAVGRPFILQNVEGLHLDQVQAPLEDLGLMLNVEEVWSTEPQGKILAQDPAAGTEVRSGTTLTLTVSGGTDVRRRLDINFDQRIMLEEALAPQGEFHAGDSVSVILYWRAMTSIERAYTVFVHLIPEGGTMPIAQDDSEPARGTHPTNTWEPGEIVIDPHQVTLPSDSPAGVYQVWVGLYTAEGRLPVANAGEIEVRDNSVLITTVEVRP
ncbi:MAG: protein kinase domain-containing protein [Anaerolineae bacterium]